MEDEIRLPQDRDNLTGRHTRNSESIYAKNRSLLLRRQQKAIRDSPAETRVVRELLKNVQFDVIQAMFEHINLRSAIPLEESATRSASRIRSKSKVHTNSIKRQDIFLLDPGKEGVHHIDSMQYAGGSNAIYINLRLPSVVYLTMLQTKPRPLTQKDMSHAQYNLYNFYQLLFHEMGHAYSFVQFTHNKVDQTTFSVDRGGVAIKTTLKKPLEGGRKSMVVRSTDLEFWLEGFNEVQTLYRMEAYLQNHSLRFQDIQFERRYLVDIFFHNVRHSGYGGATFAVYCVINHIANISGVARLEVFNAFAKIYQTKGGRKILLESLKNILGPALVKRIRDTSPNDVWNADVLSRDILLHLKTGPKAVEFLEEFITHPDRPDRQKGRK